MLGAWSLELPGKAQPTNAVFPIDLPTVLQLADAQNLDIQIARERLAEAKANQTSAAWQYFPWLSPGIQYRKHEGRVQAVDGAIFDASKQSLAPGVNLTAQVDLGEAHYHRLAARQLTQAAEHGADAQRQETALRAAQDYFDLLLAQAAVEVAREAIRISTNYQDQIERAVDAGVAFRGDALRVKVQSERYQLTVRQAQEQQRLAASKLAQTLHLDPAVELKAQDSDLVPLALMEAGRALSTLVQEALAGRPELKQNEAIVSAARHAHKGATYGPMIPSLGAQVFAGALGGGSGGRLGDFGDQQDYFVGLSWRVGPGGMFDSGRIKAAEARANAARWGVEKVQDEITRQVIDAAVRVSSLRDQIDTAQRALTAAEEGWRLAAQRKEFAVGVVLETIQTEQDLTRARLDYLKAVASFNQAQYTLTRALGRF